MAETNYFTIPAGYIVLSREDYDDLIEQRITSRLDRIDERTELEMQLATMTRERDEAKSREKETAYKLFQANENIIKLRAEIHLLNDELCRTDEFHEVTHAVPEE